MMDQTPPPDDLFEDEDVEVELVSESESETSDDDYYHLKPLDSDDASDCEGSFHSASLSPTSLLYSKASCDTPSNRPAQINAPTSPERPPSFLLTPPTDSPPKQEHPPRKRMRSGPESGSSPLCAQSARWNGIDDLDTAYNPQTFRPKRRLGHQLDPSCTYTPMKLFSFFVDSHVISILCNNTNKQAVHNIAKGGKYNWSPVQESEMYTFLGLSFFFCLVKLDNLKDYWKQNTIFSQSFPPKVMARERYRTISWNIHLSDPNDDLENDKRKGTPQYDPLCCLRPLLGILKMACKTHYQPRKSLCIKKKIVTAKSYMKAKPPNQEFKLFVLADSYSGYTLDFNIYTRDTLSPSGHGLPYDSVMTLLNPSYLGIGYNLYVDKFHTSPKLFKDLYYLNIGACGPYRENRRDCPQAQNNALTKKDLRGTLRWIREGPLVFVKWMDSQEVSFCSTIHPAFAGDTVMRHKKFTDVHMTVIDTTVISCPKPVIEYNKNMGGVDFSDLLIQNQAVHRKTMLWSRAAFFHLMDIAATNAYLLHKELCQENSQTPMTHRRFLEELTAQLCGVTISIPPFQAPEQHLPVRISHQTERSKRASYGRRGCVYCRKTNRKEQATPWKCHVCNVSLCLIADRNCFFMWHQKMN